MSVKEITVYLVAPIKMTVLASDDTGDVRITRILYMEPPCIADLMESCGDDGLDEIDQAFRCEPN